MKNFLRGGRGLPFGEGERVIELTSYQDLSSRPIEENTCLISTIRSSRRYTPHDDGVIVRHTAYSLWPKAITIIFCVLFSGLLVPPAWAQEAKDLVEIQPLKVGDKIPDELWNLPLKVVNHPEGKEYIRLSDYRDKKLIILDFWATWCGSCIAVMPELHRLQQMFKDDLIVISVANQNPELVNAFIAKNEVTKSVNLWSVVDEPMIDHAIPKYTLPHFTWITNGKVISNTSETALRHNYIKDFLTMGKIGWMEKVNLNIKDVFFGSLGDLSSSSHSFYYEGNLDGAGKGFGMSSFSGDRINYYFINYSQRAIFEWFLKRIARDKGTNLKEINYSQGFISSAAWQAFNGTPVSLQIIADKNKPLHAIFSQYRAMSFLGLEMDSNGFYGLATNKNGGQE